MRSLCPPTITVVEAAAQMGVSSSSAYAAIKKGDFPVPVIKIGGRYVVPTKPLLDLLGLNELPTTTEEGITE